MGGRIKRDGSYDERNRYYEKRDYSFRSTTFFVSYVTLNATTVTKSATIHYGTSNPRTRVLKHKIMDLERATFTSYRSHDPNEGTETPRPAG